MSVFSRRNAAVGWLALFVGKRVLKRKAKQALPAIDAASRRPNKSAVALLLAGIAGILTFRRRRSGDEETGEES